MSIIATVLSLLLAGESTWLDVAVSRSVRDGDDRLHILNQQLTGLRKELERVRKAPLSAKTTQYTDSGWIFKSRSDQRSRENEIILKIERVAKSIATRNTFPLLHETISVGSSGFPWKNEIVFLQIVSPNEAIVSIETSKNWTIWLQVSTNGLVDGHTMRSELPIVITGTKQYESVNGTRTIFTGRFWLQKEIDEFISRIRVKDAPTVADLTARSLSTYRVWTDASGKFRMEGAVEKLTETTIHLKRANDGNVVEVPLEKLSIGDREWVSDHKKYQQPHKNNKPEGVRRAPNVNEI